MMENNQFDVGEINDLFKYIGLSNARGGYYRERLHKHRQIFDYLIQIEAIMNRLSRKKPVVFLDCGCGRSYLSFVVYKFCIEKLQRKIRIIGVDFNQKLIDRCREAADKLNLTAMEFYTGDIIEFVPPQPVDVVYSLHACNTGTDQMIAKGLKENSRFILSVSCCQHLARSQLKKHPLARISRFKDYKERLTDMIADSMRALLLESLNYGVQVFEFTAAASTPKNIMLRAAHNRVKKEDKNNAISEYKKLYQLFNIRPQLESYVRDLLLEKAPYYSELMGDGRHKSDQVEED